jgi:hypothetical protein
MSLNSTRARVVDPVLSTHVRGYQHPERVGNLLFPSVEVPVSAGKVVEFGKESFMLYNARRAPGAATKRIDFGYEGKPYALVQDSLESKVPREYARDALEVPDIDLGMRASSTVMNALTLTLEYDQAKIATDAANYDANHKVILSGTSQWSNAAGKPVNDIEAARQAVRNSCGMYPNILVLGPVAYAAVKNNQQVVDRFRNSDVITSTMLASLLEIGRVVEGRAVVANDAGAFQDVWGDYAVLAFAPEKPDGFEQPSFGYTYTMKGNPYVEQPYWDGNTKSWIYGVTYERAPVLAGMLAGFLIENTAAGQ